MGEHRALVDRALVGHFAGIERRRLGEQDGAADAVRAAGAAAAKRVEQAREFLAHARIGDACGGRRIGGEAGRKLAAGVEVGKDQRR